MTNEPAMWPRLTPETWTFGALAGAAAARAATAP